METQNASEQVGWLTSRRIGVVEPELLARVDPAVVALTALALAAASYGLASKSLWLDEAVSFNHVSSGVRTLGGAVVGGDPNMGLYYVLLYGWTRIFGYGEAALRSLSVVVGALTVPMIVMLGRRLFGRAAGWMAGLLLALSPFFVHYEQTARGYALVVLLVTVSSYFFVCELERPSEATRVGYVLASALAVYAHYFAALVLLAQLLTLIAVRGRAALTRYWLTTVGAIVALCAPEVGFAARRGTIGIDWIPAPNVHNVLGALAQLPGGKVLAVVLFALACYGVFCGGRSWRGPFVGAWLVVPIVVDLAVSLLGRPLFLSYYLIVVLPALLLLAAAGLARLPAPVAGGGLAAFVVLSVIGVLNWYATSGQEDFRGATRYVLANERPTDGAVYYPRFTKTAMRPYEVFAHRHPPAAIRFAPARPLARRPPRIWLVIRESDVRRGLRTRIERGISAQAERLVARRSFNGVAIVLYQRQ
jgi:4-amino-4-deoxy-L-arabinose transferase-like glycosyltransferase